jgi:outer membrane biosynthesis protein TonB
MKPLRLSSTVIALLLLALISPGCQHKKPVLVMPQQPPPTAAPSPSPTPASAEAEPAEKPPEAQPAATPAEQPATAEKTKPKHGRHTAAKKPPAPAGGEKSGTEIAKNTTSKKVIPPEPEATPPIAGQISPGPSPTDATNSQTSTDQLLRGAEANLNGITRQLSKDEEAMRAQSMDFIKQSRAAITANDLARAHTLAVKARLLSDELAKQR